MFSPARADVKIKDAAKKIGKQFACGSSVSKAPSGAEEVVIQGDVLMDLPRFLETTFNVRSERERKRTGVCVLLPHQGQYRGIFVQKPK